jgi:tellurite resistance protein TehA-like permease
MYEQNRLPFSPVSFFSIVMGLTGAAIAWHKAVAMREQATWVSDGLLVLAVVVFLALLLMFGWQTGALSRCSVRGVE